MTARKWTWMAVGAVLTIGAICYVTLRRSAVVRAVSRIAQAITEPDTYTVDVTDYTPPKDDWDDLLADDKIEDKKTAFDPELVDRRPHGLWLVNSSEAVIHLDVPLVKPDLEPEYVALSPSYAAAAQLPGVDRQRLLPSVNVIDAKAKQFDDGLYAAIDQAYYKGLDETLVNPVRLVMHILKKRGGQPNTTAMYLSFGLSLTNSFLPGHPSRDRPDFVTNFRADQSQSKPIGFYTWNETLSDCFRFLRFFQQPITDVALSRDLLHAIENDPKLAADYRAIVAFYSKLTNPPDIPCIADYLDGKIQGPIDRPVSLFPAARSRETELFRKLFPEGLPPNADLMRSLITRIRSGEVDLRPRPDSGWYDYQVYALETLLLPERGAERDKLLLTRPYKKRMLEAFEALVTKRRETHVAYAASPKSAQEWAQVGLEPRLRLEPCPSYCLRTARAYEFLANFLESAIGPKALSTLHGLREGGERAPDLHTELRSMRDLFYGLYFLSAEDIGLKPDLLEGEPVDRDGCERAAAEWLEHVWDDPDLAVDTRVAVPVYNDPVRHTTRLWATLGVRLTRLDAAYARPPRIKPNDGTGDWHEPEGSGSRQYLILVDEFAEVELKGNRVLTREELRADCDAHRSKAAIVEALQQ